MIYETAPTASVSGLCVAVRVSAATNVCAIDFNNRITGDDFDFTLPQSGRIECIVYKLPLNCGNFSYGVFARSQGGVEDWIKYAGNFEVLPGDFFNTGKLPEKDWIFLADHQWKLSDQ